MPEEPAGPDQVLASETEDGGSLKETVKATGEGLVWGECSALKGLHLR